MKSKLTFNTFFYLCIFSFALIFIGCESSKPTEPIEITSEVKLTIIHINDAHGRTAAEPYISQIAKEIKSKGNNVLIIDAGDRLHGQVATNLTKGETMVDIMNTVGYSAMTLGNHDFNFGVKRIQELSTQMNFPILCANVRNSNGENLFKQSEIIIMQGLKVGLFGIITPETVNFSDPRITEGLFFDDPVQTARPIVEQLKKENCDIIIAIAHLGDNINTQSNWRSDALASIPEIDIIIDGHSHTLLPNGKNINNSLIVQAGEFEKYIGIVEVSTSDSKTFTKKSKIIETSANNYSPDPVIVAKIKETESKIEPIVSIVVGNTPFLLQGERSIVRTQETNLSNLITNSMLYASGAEISFLTGGNIRSSIPAGNITMGDVLVVLPFSNLIVTLDIAGSDLLDILEHGIELSPSETPIFIHIAGIYFEYDPNLPPKNKITNIKMADNTPFDINKKYTVATTEFLAAGGDGYTMLSKGTNIKYYRDDAEAFADYLATNPEIKPEPEGRVKIKE